MLTLYGDGVHDDTDAFQALLNGENVMDFAGKIITPQDDLRGKRITLSRAIEIKE